MKKIVVDTNVLVSEFLFGGKPGNLRLLWKKGLVVPIYSKEILEEYLRVPAYPIRLIQGPSVQPRPVEDAGSGLLPWFEGFLRRSRHLLP